MSRSRILFALAVSAFVLTLLQIFVVSMDGRWDFEALYTPSHYVAGVCLGFFALYVMKGMGWGLSLPLCLAFVLFVGVAWEILEWSNFVLGKIDTGSDIVVDLLGGYTAYWIVRTFK